MIGKVVVFLVLVGLNNVGISVLNIKNPSMLIVEFESKERKSEDILRESN